MAFTTVLSGSPGYMAPERLVGHYSPASDCFSLGLVAQEMLTGKLLSDYTVPYFEAGFVDALAATLHSIAGDNNYQVARHLMAAFDANPANRPSGLTVWVESWAVLLLDRPT